MKVAFVTPELQPILRRTQLGEVAGSLAAALQRSAGCEVHAFLPYGVRVAIDMVKELAESGIVVVKDGRRKLEVRVWTGKVGELTVHLFDEAELFQDRHPYGDENGPYADNWRRYAVFSRAVLESFELLGFAPDIIHCMDWTSGLIPLLRETEYAQHDSEHPVARAGTFMHVQNLAMQGAFEREILPEIGLSRHQFVNVSGIEHLGKVNFLKSGIEFATIVGTSSPGMAERVMELDRGYGLEEVFRRRAKEIVGITNGIDYAAWNPEVDPLLPATYSVADKNLAGKRRCKAAIQSSLTLDSGARTMLAAIMGRFDADSGFDVLGENLTAILEMNIEIVLMGGGQADIVERIRTMESSFAGRCRYIEGYDAATAHAVLGGADVLLMPAPTQPTNALGAIALRYGTVPIAYARCGLEDTVIDLSKNSRGGTGWLFDPYSPAALLEATDAARKTYKDPAKWRLVVQRGMKQDFSWEATAAEYLKAYRRVTRRTKGKVATKRRGA